MYRVQLPMWRWCWVTLGSTSVGYLKNVSGYARDRLCLCCIHGRLHMTHYGA
jgi:hypothetical protein